MADATSPDLEGDSEELDDCVDEDAFSSAEDEDDAAQLFFLFWARLGWCWKLGSRPQPCYANTHFDHLPFFIQPMVVINL